MNVHGELTSETIEVRGATVPVAVIGIGCRFPGGINSADSYWNFLKDKKTGIIEIPRTRWNVDLFYDANTSARSRTYCRVGGFMTDDVFGFDPAFFDMSPREAMSMDPQQRIALQVAFEATQDANLTIEDLRRARTGVFLGISTCDFGQLQRQGRFTASDIFAGTGSAFSIAANRISHRFGLNGPSLAVDTACSSALVALDQAVRHLSMGTCEMAFAGGVNCMLEPGPFVAFSGANMLSKSGGIFTFDQRADGFIRGEGCGIVLLKLLDHAIADGDRIYGVIRQTMVNQDGYTSTITAPSGDAQQAMLQNLMETASVDPDHVDYVEAHGTGTPVGDPIEAIAIGRVFGSTARKRPLHIGSFKPNIGHLESAAGIAGFIKALLIAQRGVALPNRNFETPNPDIPFDAFAMKVPTELTPLGEDGAPVLTAVNSFGFGGTNASVLIEQWEASSSHRHIEIRPLPKGKPAVFEISAPSAQGLASWAKSLAIALEDDGALSGTSIEVVQQHLQTRRDQFAHRAGIVVSPDRAALRGALSELGEELAEGSASRASKVVVGRASKRKLGLVFSGQGGQWWGMARRLLLEDTGFRATVERVDEVLRPLVGWSTIEEMLKPEEISRINTAEVTQAAIFSTQMALFEYWERKGLRPELVTGHSFGEVAAACSTGYIAIEDAARLISLRGQVPKRCSARGAMAAIGLTPEQLNPLLRDFDGVIVGAFNGPVAQTISGREDAVIAAMAEISKAYPDVLVRRMQMDFAWHSELLDEIKDWFVSELGEVKPLEGRIPMVSTVTGKLEVYFDEAYWWENLRQPVSFTKSIDLCLALGTNAFLELGPHRTLTPLAKGIAQAAGKDAVSVTSLDRTADDFATLAVAEAELFVSGVHSLRARTGGPIAGIPKYPWNNEQMRSMPEETDAFLFEDAPHPLLGRREFLAGPTWLNEITLSNYHYLVDHTVGGDVLFPAVGYIEIMGAALRDFHGDGPVELRDFKLHQATSITDDDVVIFSTTLDPVSNRISISTMHRGMDRVWNLRAEAYGFRHDYELPAAPADMVKPDMTTVDKTEFYRLTNRHGLQYGPEFRQVQGMQINEVAAIAKIEGEEDAPAGYFAFPGTFDSALQPSIAVAARDDGNWVPGVLLPAEDEDETDYRMRLPIGARKVFLKAPLTRQVILETTEGMLESSARLRVFSPEGEPLVFVEDLSSKIVGTRRATNKGYAAKPSIFEEYLERQAAEPCEDIAGSRWLLLASDLGFSSVAAELERRGGQVEWGDFAPFKAMDIPAAASIIDRFMEQDPGRGGIVYCAAEPVEAASEDGMIPDSVLADVMEHARQLTTLGQVCAQLTASSRPLPRIAVVTRTSRLTGLEEVGSIDGLRDSGLVGMSRTLTNELQIGDLRLVDADADAFAEGAAIVDALTEDTAEREFVLRGTERFVARLESKPLEDVSPAVRSLDRVPDASNFCVTMTSAGSIDNIVLREIDMPVCGPGEIIVEVAAVGLNFRDILAATSILPGELEGDEAYWRNLGLEFSGTVAARGEGVTHLKPGDKVMGMGKGFLRRYAKTHGSAVMRLPADFDLQEAATMPVAFMTARYALSDVGMLDEGESVLIQLASGGVGLAAIQVAKDLGASRIFGTAGSDTKREHVRALGLEAVMNSRSLEFAEQLLEHTCGEGVDVVLNSLSGAGIDKSLECLAPFGRMVEIGKRDLADDKPIGLGSLYRNNAYSVIDLSTLPTDKPKRFVKLLAAVEEKVASGAYRPLKATYFPVSRTAEAMRTLFQAQHVGKIVVSMIEPVVDVEVALTREIELSSEASYLVTGGLKGFGVVIGDWLSQRGAGTVVLANRSGKPDEEVSEAINRMEQRGTMVIAASLDVTDKAAVNRLVAQLASDERPLRGIVHGAAVIEDAFISQIDEGKLERVILPKVAGAINLHNALQWHAVDLDFFVNMSSIAELVGSAGQANYTAANSVLNTLAAYRSSRGLPAVSIAWGAISGSGFVSRSEALANYLESAGIKPIEAKEAVLALDSLLRVDRDTLAFANVDWSAISRANPGALKNPRLKPLLNSIGVERSRLQQELLELPRDRWEALLASHITADLAKVLKVEESTIAGDRKLTELGLDSLSAFELKNRIEATVDLEIPIAQFIQAPTIEKLAALVAGTLDRKLELAVAQSQSAGGAAAVAGSASGEYQPLARQLEALEVCRRPMSTAAAIYDNQLFASALAPSGLGVTQLNERLEKLSRSHDAICLVGSFSGGEAKIERKSAPQIEVLGPERTSLLVRGEGYLWRFVLRVRGDGQLILEAYAHRAAADAKLVQAVVDALCAEDFAPGDQIDPASASASKADHRIRQDFAFWRESLGAATPHVRIPGRRRAWTSGNLGRNRGTSGIATSSFSFSSDRGSANISIALLAGFITTLADRYSAESVVVDHWFSCRSASETPADNSFGESFFPLVMPRISRQEAHLCGDIAGRLAEARRHLSVDTPMLERELGEWLANCQIDLRQFGFAWLEPNHVTLAENPFGNVPITPQEVQLAGTCDKSGLHLRLAVDLDIFDEAEARELLQATVVNLQRLLPLADPAANTAINWQERQWPELPVEHPKEEARSPFEGLRNFDREMPVTYRHDYFIKISESETASPLTKSVFTMSKEFIIRPQTDFSRLQSAVETIVERHEALRRRFVRKEDGSYVSYLEKNQTGDQYVFIENLPDEESARRRAEEIASETINVTDRLLRIHVLRFGEEGDVIVSQAHHIVVDGYSLGLIMEEVVKAYVNLPLPTIGITLDQFYNEYFNDADLLEARRKFTEKLYADPPPVPRFGRAIKGKNPNHYFIDAGVAAHDDQVLGAAPSERLQNVAKQAGCTVAQLVMAAFSKGICKFGEVDEAFISVTHSLRHDSRLEYLVENVAGFIPVRVKAGEDHSLVDVAASIADELNNGLALAPYDIPFSALLDELVAKGSYADLFLAGEVTSGKWLVNTTSAPLQRPNSEGDVEMGPFKITNLPSQKIQNPALYELLMRSYPTDDGLGFVFQYDNLGLDAQEAAVFVAYVRSLLEA